MSADWNPAIQKAWGPFPRAGFLKSQYLFILPRESFAAKTTQFAFTGALTRMSRQSWSEVLGAVPGRNLGLKWSYIYWAKVLYNDGRGHRPTIVPSPQNRRWGLGDILTSIFAELLTAETTRIAKSSWDWVTFNVARQRDESRHLLTLKELYKMSYFSGKLCFHSEQAIFSTGSPWLIFIAYWLSRHSSKLRKKKGEKRKARYSGSIQIELG